MSTISNLPLPLPPDPNPTNPNNPNNPNTPAPLPTSPVLTDAITWGTQLPDNVITVYFAPSGYVSTSLLGQITSEGFTGYEIEQFQQAFAAIETVINVDFVITNNPAQADFTLVMDTNELETGLLGLFGPPGTFGAGTGIFNGAEWDREPGGDLAVGGFGYVTIVHGLLHGRGLAHPHDNGGTSFVMTGVTSQFGSFGDFDLNQGIYTTMSYNSGYQTGPGGTGQSGSNGVTFGFEAGPMALDIAVLQSLYGANTTHASGNDVYVLPTGSDTGTYWQSIWDTGGTDTLVQQGGGGAVINLNAATLQYETGGGGFASHANGTPGGFTIANGVVIENATGGNGADDITGNNIANVLLGRDGADTMDGGVGNDTMEGGEGSDFMIGGIGFDTMRGDNGDDTLSGELHADRLEGGAGNDSLDGGQGFDLLYGGTGNDELFGGDDPDRLYGGAGDDLLNGGLNFGNTVDGLYGEAGNDSLYGNAGFDFLDGGEGDDLLDGGHQADNLYGREGNDTLLGDLGLDRLFGGTGNDLARGGEGDDGLFGEEGRDRLFGEAGNDRFFGGTGDDTLLGGAGNDTLYGGAGFDTLVGGTGNDLLKGDFNADTFVFADGHGVDTITDFAATNQFEKIDLSDVSAITELADLQANHLTQQGANVVIDTGGGNTITLNGVNLADLDATDFIF